VSPATVPHDTSVTEPRRHRWLRVFVCDPAELVRQGIRTTLTRQRDIAVAGESVGGPSTSEITANLAPDVALLGADRILPDTLGTVKAIDQQVSGCRVILFSPSVCARP
jgi:chemotaxis response regulator CheB